MQYMKPKIVGSVMQDKDIFSSFNVYGSINQINREYVEKLYETKGYKIPNIVTFIRRTP